MATTVRPDSGADRQLSSVRRGIVSRSDLFDKLREAGRVVYLSAPAGSGKRTLLRSWISESGLAENTAWVAVGPDHRDPQGFWISLADALRATKSGSNVVEALTAAPGLDGWAIVERLVANLGQLEERIWLVIDNLDELRADEAQRQLELLLMRSPSNLRFVLATRHDLRLGLHRLRLEGELTEIRAADLRFTLAHARKLFEAAGLQLSDSAIGLLLERTEGWVAGLRLAALLLRGHPNPEQFATEFSGTERTVADYMLAEVLERQPDQVRRLLLRTSVLERVSGPLADHLTGSSGGERILQQLEEANAFVISLDARRSWFRYHRLFADLLQLELRRSEPDELPRLHGAASDWYAQHGYPIEAIRHAQAAGRWNEASRLLSDHWLGFELDGLAATNYELLSRFPDGIVAGPELSAMRASAELTNGSVDRAEVHLAAATRGLTSVPAERRRGLDVRLAILRITLARRQGNLPVVVEEAHQLVARARELEASQVGLGEDLRAVYLLSVGIAELWSNQSAEADRHLEQAVALARRINRPFLEINALGNWALLVRLQSFALALERSRLAIELAQKHGWGEAPVVFTAYLTLGNTLVWQGRLDEAEHWLELAQRTSSGGSTDPTNAMMLHVARGFLETLRGRLDDAHATFRAAERLAESVVTPLKLAQQARAFALGTLLNMGKRESVEHAFSQMSDMDLELGDTRTVLGALRIAQGKPEEAIAVLAPVIDGSVGVTWPGWLWRALILDGTARDALGDGEGADRSLERALDYAEVDGAILPFLLHPNPQVLQRHARRRTGHAALIADILTFLSGNQPASHRGEQRTLREPLSESETRILRYLPTNLSVPEIADQTYLSVNTVKTHMRHLYGKLSAHSRGKAVERARTLGLLAPSALRTAARS